MTLALFERFRSELESNHGVERDDSAINDRLAHGPQCHVRNAICP
jgi:hypothetical protein